MLYISLIKFSGGGSKWEEDESLRSADHDLIHVYAISI